MDLELANVIRWPLQKVLIAIAITGFLSFFIVLLSPDSTKEAVIVKSPDPFEYNKFRDREDVKPVLHDDEVVFYLLSQ